LKIWILKTIKEKGKSKKNVLRKGEKNSQINYFLSEIELTEKKEYI